MRRIYLDQWVYIKLVRTYKRLQPEYPKHKHLCKKIIESSKAGTNQFPFSIAHLYETMKRTKLSSRKDLFKFIFELSKFYTIRPWTQVIDLEIRNAIRKSLKINPCDLSNYVFGNGVAHCFGNKVELKSIDSNEEISNEIKEKVFSASTNPELMAEALCKDQMIKMVKRSIQRDEILADRLEGMRKEEYGYPDKKVRKNISDAIFFISAINERLIKAVLDFQLDPEKYIKNIFMSKKSAENFLKSVPTAYVFHVLNDARNMNFNRPIEPNDLWDLGALAIAVPYCDIVVTEREWANILNQKSIGELYNTKILHKIEDLYIFV